MIVVVFCLGDYAQKLEVSNLEFRGWDRLKDIYIYIKVLMSCWMNSLDMFVRINFMGYSSESCRI